MIDNTSTYYSGRSTNWVALGLTTAIVVPLLVMGGPWSKASWTALGFLIPLGVVLVVIVFNLLTTSSIRTIAGANGVSVHFGVFGWPRFRYPLTRIHQVEAVEIPKSWWAWGINWSPRRGLLLTLCNGPGLRLTLTNNRKVTISTPHPEDAVRAITAARPNP